MHFISTFFSCVAIFLSAFTLFKLNQFQEPTFKSNENQKELTVFLLDRAKNCILHNAEIQGKADIVSLINSLDNCGTVIEAGSDELRAKYVSLQGSIEHVLACAMVLGEINQLVGVIHTPTPATPLCTSVDDLDVQLLDESIRYDLQKLLTVRSRAVIVREYLENGGKLFIAYPQGGLEKRSSQQQEIYKQELAKYADYLVDTVLSCKEMDPSKVGATYFFKSAKNELYVFSIKANQANNPLESSEWGLWLGKVENHAMNERISEIMDYLAANGAPKALIELKPDSMRSS